MIKRILVTTDASEYSRRALSVAVEYAKKFNAEIEIFHVIASPRNYMSLYSFDLTQEDINDIGRTVIDKTLKGLDVSDVRIIKKTVTGYPEIEIINETNNDFDLVVMGTYGYGPLAGIVAGSVTQRVLARAACPVLVVK